MDGGMNAAFLVFLTDIKKERGSKIGCLVCINLFIFVY